MNSVQATQQRSLRFLNDVKHVWTSGETCQDIMALTIGTMWVQTAREVLKQLGDISPYLFVMADVETGQCLVLEDPPKVSRRILKAPRFKEMPKHVATNLHILKRNSHVKVMNHDQYRLLVYKKAVVDELSKLKKWSRDVVPRKLAKLSSDTFPGLTQNRDPYDFDSALDPISVWGALNNDIKKSKTECSFCNEPGRGLKRCAGCNRRYYCSKACQLEDWKGGHKESCQAERDACYSSDMDRDKAADFIRLYHVAV